MELLGVLPAVFAILLVVWQLVLAGYAMRLAADAARVAARAQLVGRDARAAARSVLPAGLRSGLDVQTGQAGPARVRVPVPFLHRSWAGPVKVAAAASLEAQR